MSNIIYETKNFIVEAFDKPHVARDDGGHIKIYPKKKILDRTKMSPETAIEFIRLTMVIGKAMEKGMNNRGIEIKRINYLDMGNWAFKKGKPALFLYTYLRKGKKCQISALSGSSSAA
jgi:diadenosine tetraphosphate (Ap4A) HIT family hydrolase